jgi:Rod binding domain-containing protein
VTTPIAGRGPDLAAWAARPDAVPLERAAQAFEALLLQQIVEKAQEPVFESRLLGGGAASSLYRSWFAQEVAGQMAARGGFGLAAATLRELAANDAAKEKP